MTVSTATTVASCQCGCGNPAPIARKNEKAKGIVKGQPLRYVHGHGGRGKGHQGCDEPGCPNAHHANGYCATHNWRIQHHGSTAPGPRSMSPVELFWSKVEKNGPLSTHRPGLGPCWLWTGNVYEDTGYGQITARRRPTPTGTNLAHRAAYELLVRSIPDGHQVDHLCRVRHCVNPAHLEPVTPKVNTERGLHGELRTRCSEGHELTPENTYVRPSDNSRRCRICMHDRDLADRADPVKYEAKKAASRRWKAKRRAQLANSRAKQNSLEGIGR